MSSAGSAVCLLGLRAGKQTNPGRQDKAPFGKPVARSSHSAGARGQRSSAHSGDTFGQVQSVRRRFAISASMGLHFVLGAHDRLASSGQIH